MSNSNCSVQRVCIESKLLGQQPVLFLGERSMTIKHFMSLPEADITTMIFGEAIGNVVIDSGNKKEVYGVYSYNNRVYISKFYFEDEEEQTKLVRQALTNSITYRKMMQVESRLSAISLKESLEARHCKIKAGSDPVKLRIAIDGGHGIPRAVRVSSDITSNIAVFRTDRVFKISMLPTKRSFDEGIKRAVLSALSKEGGNIYDSRESISDVLSAMKNMGVRIADPFGEICIATSPINPESNVTVEITISCPEILGYNTITTYETIQVGVPPEIKQAVDEVCNELEVTYEDSVRLVNDYRKLRKTIEAVEEKAVNNVRNAYKTRLFVGNNIK